MDEIKANATILKVLAHFDSRGGFSGWWDSIDEENQTEILTFAELKGTEKEVIESSIQNTKERSRLFKKAKSLSEPVKDRQNSLSHMEATKINPRTHSTKGISKVYPK